jgi:hypothetical protein
MNRKRIFISFDYDHDLDHHHLLQELVAHPRPDVEFDEITPEEYQKYDFSRMKAALTLKMSLATHTLVIVGENANASHPEGAEIGDRNWQWWEINKSNRVGNPFIAVKIAPSNAAPEPFAGKDVIWAESFTVESIFKAIDQA